MRNPDPSGYYAALGVRPEAGELELKAAFRQRARKLHPDVPGTGNAEAFRRLTAAYKILSDPHERRNYDRGAAFTNTAATSTVPPRAQLRPSRQGLWIAVGGAVAVACCTWLLVATIGGADRGETNPPPIKATLDKPADASAVQASTPVVPVSKLAGPPTHYVLPGSGPAILWRGAPGASLARIGSLPPFTRVHAEGTVKDGLQPVALAGGAKGFIEAERLMAGDARDAERARCAYSAGIPPINGELLTTGASGPARLTLENRAPTSAVVTLLRSDGQVAVRVFLAAGATANLNGLSGAPWTEQAEFGELWSRACTSFVSGSRIQRSLRLIKPGTTVPVDPDASGQ